MLAHALGVQKCTEMYINDGNKHSPTPSRRTRSCQVSSSRAMRLLSSHQSSFTYSHTRTFHPVSIPISIQLFNYFRIHN